MTTITIKRAIIDRLIDAWDSTVLPKSRDGMMQERMEDLRDALAAPATAPSWQDAPTVPGLWAHDGRIFTVFHPEVWRLDGRCYGPIPKYRP